MLKVRPIGVTIISILIIIAGLFFILSGTGMISLSYLFSALIDQNFESSVLESLYGNLSANFSEPEFQQILSSSQNILFFVGILVTIFGIANIIVSYGLLKGKNWAWLTTLILTLLSSTISILSLFFSAFLSIYSSDFILYNLGNIIILLIDSIIVFFLFRPITKFYFGRFKNKHVSM